MGRMRITLIACIIGWASVAVADGPHTFVCYEIPPTMTPTATSTVTPVPTSTALPTSTPTRVVAPGVTPHPPACNVIPWINLSTGTNPGAQAGSGEVYHTTVDIMALAVPGMATVRAFRLLTDCPGEPITLNCRGTGAVFRYEGDRTLTSNCPGVTWSTGHMDPFASGDPIVFRASTPITLGEYSTACRVEFDQRLIGGTPGGVTYNLTGFDGLLGNVGTTDATCVGGRYSTGLDSNQILFAQ